MEDSAGDTRDSLREVVPARPRAKDVVLLATWAAVSLLMVCVMALMIVSGIELFGGRLGTATVGAAFIVLGLLGVYSSVLPLFGQQVLTVGGGRASVHLELLGIESRRRTISVAQGAQVRVVPESDGRALVWLDGLSLGNSGLSASVGVECLTQSEAQQYLERLRRLSGSGLGDPSNKRIEPTRQA